MIARRLTPPELRDHLSGFGYDDVTKERTGNMSDFNYLAPALLFAAQGRSGLRYRRFLNAAEAIRYAVEKLPSDAQPSARLEVEHKCYDADQIRNLYDNAPTRRIAPR